MERLLTPEELLAHARWMRPLARSLMRDEHAAEDVVQESLAAALRRPPDTTRPLAPWLARVVRNVAARFRRDEGRLAERHARHAASGPCSAEADPLSSLERLDTQRLLLELVRGLDEPLRATIVLAYFEGLTSVEIARRTGVPDATVRWRIQRALEVLRARLGERHGSRAAWCGLLAPFAGSTGSVGTMAVGAAGTSAAAGALAMGTSLKVVLAAAVLAVVGAGVWWSQTEREPGPKAAEAAHATAEPATEALPDPSEPGPAEPAPSEREARAPASVPPVADAAPATATPPVADAALCTVRARFVDTAGLPWAGVTFELAQRDRTRLSDPTRGSTVAGADGRVELAFALQELYGEVNLGLTASRPGCAPRTLRVTPLKGGTVDLGLVVLEREARVLGRVHDAAGTGLADVTVGLTRAEFAATEAGELRRRGPNHEDRLLETRTDARGDFEVRGVSPGNWCLWGHREDLGYGASAPFEIAAGAELRGIEFEVPPLAATDTLGGVVLGAEGEPQAGATVTFVWQSDRASGSSSCTSRADGKFELVLNREASGEVFAEDQARTQRSATLRDVAPGARGLVLRLGGPLVRPMARIFVHGPANEPVRGIQRISVYERQGHGGHIGSPLDVRELEPGRYEFRAPGAPFWLQVEADGYVTGRLKDGQGMDLDPERLSAELDLSLAVAPRLRGRVTAAGVAVGEATVEALSAVRPGRRMTVNGFPSRMNPWPDAAGSSAADGTFTLKLQGEDSIYLRCVAPGFAPAIVGPLSPAALDAPGDPGAPDTSVEIELVAGGALEGRARAQDGTTVAGAIVGITCGDGHPRTMLSGLDGSYRFENLTPGPWLVLERDEEVDDGVSTDTSPGERPIVWSCTVTSGGTARFDLTLSR